MRRAALRLATTLLLAFVALAAAQERYDVVVVGTEPEAIMAAVAAAEEGARTALVGREDRLGGLFVRGALNVLDLRTHPFSYQQGLFTRWWARVGGGHAFDVDRAEAVFRAMLAEASVDVFVGSAEPLLASRADGIGSPAGPAPETIVGVRVGLQVGELRLWSDQVIDGTADADFAAAAGAGSTIGFASLGYPERMADTLVFALDGIDWRLLTESVEARGRRYASIDERVAWGSFGGVPAAYAPSDPTLRLRGLNLGRESTGKVWVNALLIYGIDPFDPNSLAAGRERAAAEVPAIVAYLQTRIPGFEQVRVAGFAESLYVRETRHLNALCTLTADDVLDNRVTAAAIAAGGYPLDVQSLTPNDSGFVFGVPDIYGVELCVTVPTGLDGLWVVGHSAGFDPIAHASARVVPLGIAVAEAVGVAASRAATSASSPREFVEDPQRIAEVRERLLERGAYLPTPRGRTPVGPVGHPHYDAYRTLLARGLAVGGYDNEPRLDEPVSALGYVYLLANVGQRFLGRPELGRHLVASHGGEPSELTPDLAAEITSAAGCALGRCPNAVDWNALQAIGLAPPGFAPGTDTLTRGDIYALAAHIATGLPELGTDPADDPADPQP